MICYVLTALLLCSPALAQIQRSPSLPRLGLLNDPAAATEAVRKSFFNARLAELRAEMDMLRAQIGTGDGSRIQPYAQVKHTPSGPVLTASVQPFGVTLVNPNSNIGWWKFSSTDAAANVKTRATLNTQFWYTGMFGDQNVPNVAPQNGVPKNWKAVYANYPAFLADGVTRDPRDLMPILPDGIHLKARKRLASSSDTAPFEMAQLRALPEFRPGDYMEMRARMPSQRRAAGSKWSWPVFWTFSAWQDWTTGTRYYCQPNKCLELDIKDTYQNQGERQGTVINHGVVLYGDPANYNNPTTTFISNHPDYQPRGAATNALRVFPAPEVDPTEGFYTYGIDWAADNSKITYLVNGRVTWIHNVFSPSINKSTSTDGNAGFDNGPFDPTREGTVLGQFVQIAHQFGVNFNGGDIRLLNQAAATGHVEADPMIVQHFGIWRSNANVPAPPVPAEAANLTLDGKTYTWSNKGDARAYTGPNHLAIVAQPSNNGSEHQLVRAMEATTGTWTGKIVMIYPGVDHYQGGILLKNSATGSTTKMVGLYPKPVSTYMSATTDFGGLTKHGKSADRSGLRLNEYGCGRIVKTVTVASVWVSTSADCTAGTWERVGADIPSSATDSPNQVGIWMNAADPTSIGVPGQLRAQYLRYSPSTNPQDAVPAN